MPGFKMRGGIRLKAQCCGQKLGIYEKLGIKNEKQEVVGKVGSGLEN